MHQREFWVAVWRQNDHDKNTAMGEKRPVLAETAEAAAEIAAHMSPTIIDGKEYKPLMIG